MIPKDELEKVKEIAMKYGVGELYLIGTQNIYTIKECLDLLIKKIEEKLIELKKNVKHQILKENQ